MNRQYARNALLAGGLALAMGCCRSEPISGRYDEHIVDGYMAVLAVDGKVYDIKIDFDFCSDSRAPSKLLLMRAAQQANRESDNPIVSISRPYNVQCIGNLCEAKTCSNSISFSTPESADPKEKS